MGTMTEDQNPSSKTGSNQAWTLYNEYQAELSSQSQDKSSKGKSSRRKDKKQEGSAPGGAPAAAAAAEEEADPNGDATQNNPGPLKKRIEKKYEAPPAVRGFKKDEMSLEIMLLQDVGVGSLNKIGVVGQRGVGKTTLCRKILENERVKKSYSKMFWVTLSEVEVPKIEEPEVTVADGIVELTSDAKGVSSRLNRDDLSQQLKEDMYLIVFDGVWEAEENDYYKNLENCITGLPNEKGGAVIVTCRTEEAAEKLVGDENMHRLQPLNNPDSCWWIYNEAVRGKEIAEDKTVSKEVKEELMKRCGGLPWAAQMMGKIKAQQLAKANQNNDTQVS
ncbi:hypothetical protein HRI_003690900 [Hibiscus trionum]|uniref:NB-ARC domain-containing protein n=1 Tax=Hibiscus trionum TaxID=183268 RepID=A0A9W7IQH4_HIBTR|nr:hypothetical protein HRI_003690900 [Hibiscus trionum]